jgi:hypothetical protein
MNMEPSLSITLSTRRHAVGARGLCRAQPHRISSRGVSTAASARSRIHSHSSCRFRIARSPPSPRQARADTIDALCVHIKLVVLGQNATQHDLATGNALVLDHAPVLRLAVFLAWGHCAQAAPGNGLGLHYSRFQLCPHNTSHGYQIPVENRAAKIGASEGRIREDGLAPLFGHHARRFAASATVRAKAIRAEASG